MNNSSNDSAFNDLAFSPESSLKPEKLLEGIQDFPSLYSWDRVATGRTLTLPALMKIGLIYSFVWTFKKIDTGLRNLMVINLIYGILTDLVMAVLNMSVNVGQTMLFVFNLSVDLIPIKSELSNSNNIFYKCVSFFLIIEWQRRRWPQRP